MKNSFKLAIIFLIIALFINSVQSIDEAIPDCLQFTQSGTCQICLPGFQVSWDHLKCIPFKQNNYDFWGAEVQQAQNKACNVNFCNTCVSNNPQACQNCSSTYTLNIISNTCYCNNGTSSQNCTSCNIANCRLCSSADVCSDCNQGYDLNTVQDSCILCNINNCNTCSSNNVCSNCLVGIPTLDGSACISACSNGCQVCNSTMCLGCTPGWLFNTNMTQCFLCSLDGCRFCSANNTCQSCFLGYTLISSACVVCNPPCKTCNANGTCADCISLYSLTPNTTNGLCFQCNVAFCSVCSDPNTCTTCATGWSASGGKCALTCGDSNCLTCSTSSTICTTCRNYYYVNSSNGCSLCNNFPNCLTCNPSNPSNCTLCNIGFWANSSGICVQCPNWCQSCNGTSCTKTKLTWGVVSYQLGLKLAACDSGCQICNYNRPSGCQMCLRGFSLNQNGYCQLCSSPCKTCQNGNSSNCTSCLPGSVWISSNMSCQTCLSSCYTCKSSNTSFCTSCSFGVALNNGVCSGNCPKFCKTCSNTSTCLSCQQGFGLNATNGCTPCLTGCAQCSGTFPTICLGCGVGFGTQISSNQTRTCVACPSNCMTCVIANSRAICKQCNSGYMINSTFGCSVNCKFPCATCQNGSPSICTSCFVGYSINSVSSSCSPQLTFSNTTQTGVCPFGYMMSTGLCQQCVGNCARCNVNTNICTGCRLGLYLSSNNQCLNCPSGCTSCTNLKTCLTCQSGYYLPLTTASNPQVCKSCASPCSTCIGSQNKCITCVNGYALQGWACVTSFNLKVTVVLDTTFVAFFGRSGSTSPYYIYLIQLQVASLSSSIINITTATLTQGSVSAQTDIDQDQANSGTVTSSYDGVQALLSSGSIAGSSIISYSVTAEGGSLPSTGVNLALILGICIPLGIILIIAIGILIYCKFKKSSDIIQYKIKKEGTTVRQSFQLSNDITGRRLEAI